MVQVYAFNFTLASFFGRAFAYFLCWVLFVSTSGAHFNPATSFAVYLAEGKYGRQFGRLLVYWLFQLMGAYAGIFVTWLVFKDPIMGFLLWPMVQIPNVRIWFFSELGNIYYAKILFLEMLNTATFIWIYLRIIYRPALRTVDEIIKGLGAAFALYGCYFLSAGSGACYNPALGLA